MKAVVVLKQRRLRHPLLLGSLLAGFVLSVLPLLGGFSFVVRRDVVVGSLGFVILAISVLVAARPLVCVSSPRTVVVSRAVSASGSLPAVGGPCRKSRPVSLLLVSARILFKNAAAWFLSAMCAFNFAFWRGLPTPTDAAESSVSSISSKPALVTFKVACMYAADARFRCCVVMYFNTMRDWMEVPCNTATSSMDSTTGAAHGVNSVPFRPPSVFSFSYQSASLRRYLIFSSYEATTEVRSYISEVATAWDCKAAV